MKRKPRVQRTLVSVHELKLFCVVAREQGWWTSRDIAQKAGVKRRAAHEHLMRWLDFGMVERIEMTPEHQWRVSSEANNASHYKRLESIALRLEWLKL